MIMMSATDPEKKYKSTMTHLISLKYVTPEFSDKASNHCWFTESTVNQDIFHKFNRKIDRLEDFYF